GRGAVGERPVADADVGRHGEAGGGAGQAPGGGEVDLEVAPAERAAALDDDVGDGQANGGEADDDDAQEQRRLHLLARPTELGLQDDGERDEGDERQHGGDGGVAGAERPQLLVGGAGGGAAGRRRTQLGWGHGSLGGSLGG